MSARNTFVTSFIYWPAAIKIVEEILNAANGVEVGNFFGRHDNAGYFSGRMDTLSEPPMLLEDLLEKIDKAFSGIEYNVYFDIAIVCDDAEMVLHRRTRMDLS